MTDGNAKRPHIVVFQSDDTNVEMLGYGGGKTLSPTIDRIAREGVRADAFHCASTVCTPSRYSFLTGRFAGRCASPRFRRAVDEDGEPYNVGFNTRLEPEREDTVARALQRAGYTTGFTGKWHVGPDDKALGLDLFQPDEDPRDPDVAERLRRHQEGVCAQVRANGFDYAGGVYWGNTHDLPLEALNVHNLEWITRHALDFIDAHAGGETPVFLWVCPTTIHGPGHIEGMLSDHRITAAGYEDRQIGCQAARASVYDRIRDAPEVAFDYIGAGVLWMDDMLAAIMAKLRELGIEDETAVIYTADHGAMDGKATPYQGGTRIPFAMRWPGEIPAGTTTSALMENVDLRPTLLEMAGAGAEAERGTDGKSALPALRGAVPAAEHREELYFEHGYARAVRTRRWKYIAYRLPQELVERMKRGEVEKPYDFRGSTGDNTLQAIRYPHYFDPDQLYDLRADPEEQRNLADDPAHRAVLRDMRRRLRRWLDDLDAPYWDLEDRDPFYGSPAHQALEANTGDISEMEHHEWWRKHWW